MRERIRAYVKERIQKYSEEEIDKEAEGEGLRKRGRVIYITTLHTTLRPRESRELNQFSGTSGKNIAAHLSENIRGEMEREWKRGGGKERGERNAAVQNEKVGIFLCILCEYHRHL